VSKSEGFKLSAEAADLIAFAADGSFRDALGLVQKVILAAADKIASTDEVASIIGAPKKQVIMNLISALAKKDISEALTQIRTASSTNPIFFMKLFLEHLRLILLLRHDRSQAKAITEQYEESTVLALEDYARNTTHINAAVLQRFLTAYNECTVSPIPLLPLEVACIDIIS
jgi:DNA polymerase III gamma/tau subunit